MTKVTFKPTHFLFGGLRLIGRIPTQNFIVNLISSSRNYTPKNLLEHIHKVVIGSFHALF